MKILSILLVLIFSSCALTYQPPIGSSKTVKALFKNNESFDKVKRILIIDGYDLTYSNKLEGLISTAFKTKKINHLQADCGKTMGLDYLKDNRTKTEVAFTIIINEDLIEIKSKIRAEYKPTGAASQTIDLTCISKGVLEEELLNKIKE